MRLNMRSTDLSNKQRQVSDLDGISVVRRSAFSPLAVTVILTASATFVFLIGVLVYFSDRPPASTLLIPTIAPFVQHNRFGVLGQWLPSFVHPFAFSLFTVAALGSAAPAWRYGACALWLGINVCFEVGQHAVFKSPLTEAMNAGPGECAIARSVLNYLIHGTFDVGDMLAAVLGALAAAALLYLVDRCRELHHALQ